MKNLVLFFLIIIFVQIANAQRTPINPDIVLKDKTISTDSQKTIKTAIKEEIFTTTKKETPKTTVPNAKTPPIAPKIDLKFTPTDQLFLQKKIAGTDKQSAEIRQLIYIIWQGYVENSKENGFEYNDLARAISYSIFASYRVLNDSEDIPKENVRKLYEQIKEVFSDNADFGKLNNDQKQELAEQIVFQAGLSILLAMAAEEEENMEMEKQAKDLAKKNLEDLLGISAFKLKITANGLEEK